MILLLWLGGCGADPDPAHAPVATDTTDTPVATDTVTDATDTTDVDPGPCGLPGMAVVADAFCVDVAEASLESFEDGAWTPRPPWGPLATGERVRAVSRLGRVPQGYISGDEAAAACAEAGKRLCSSTEWLQACKGPDGWTFPYGPTWQEGACNDHYDGGHPVVDWFGTADGVWDTVHMNDPNINQQPGTVTPSGERSACRSAWGAYDMHGNLHEWVDDASGVFRGGFYADASINGPGCTYTTTAHARSYHDYSTGFRCCADLP